MCGILGYVGEPSEGQWGQTHRLLEALFLNSEKRGKHATGFVARTAPFKAPLYRRIITDKAPLPASQFITNNSKWRSLRHHRCSMFVGHVRMATHGDPAEPMNNHPHQGENVWLVHNGVIYGHELTAHQHGLRLNSQCDSELILRMVESVKEPAQGLQRAMDRLRGSMAVALLDAKRHIVWLARNEGRPLWTLKLRGDRRWFFASEQEILLEAIEQVLGMTTKHRIEILLPLASGYVHGLSPYGMLMALEQ